MKKFFKTHAKLCIAVLALALVTVGGTLALMATSPKALLNNFTAASIDTEIKEEVSGDGTKQVSITNKGPSDAYVRARIMVSGVENGQVQIVKTTEEANAKAKNNPDKVYLVMGEGYDDEKNPWNWEKDLTVSDFDGFYYYLDVVETGEFTNKLLEKVVFGSELQNDEFLAGFNITVYHESMLAINKPATSDGKVTLEMVTDSFKNAVPTTNPDT